MKTIVLFLTALFTLTTSKAQYSQNFDGTEASLTGNCWTLTGVFSTNTSGDVINGTGSLITNPPTSGAGTRDIISPALNVTSTNLNVSFNYKVSNPLNGIATRTIEIGLLDVSANYTQLQTIVISNNSPTGVQNFNQNFVVGILGIKRLVIKVTGANGDGSSRIIIDDLYVSASAMYGTGTCNSAPVAVNDVFSGQVGTVITGNVLTNDNEPDGEVMTPSIVVTSADGVVVLFSNGNFSFTPAVGFTGLQTTFTYRLNDGGFTALNSNIATVTLNFFLPNPLPIKLISFDAKYNKPDVTLNWSTAQEKNFSHFVIEQSTDGINFNEMAVVFGAGESDIQRNYSYTDRNMSGRNGLVYYRLKSVDVDTKTSFSSIRIIRLEGEKALISISSYPNPVTSELRITIPASWQNKNVTYEIFSANGQPVKKTQTANSSQTETLNVSTMAPGFYVVRVNCEGQTAQQKIVKH